MTATTVGVTGRAGAHPERSISPMRPRTLKSKARRAVVVPAARR
jgi:hypothetical protein